MPAIVKEAMNEKTQNAERFNRSDVLRFYALR
jgi:hypothetical protein